MGTSYGTVARALVYIPMYITLYIITVTVIITPVGNNVYGEVYKLESTAINSNQSLYSC